MDYFINEGNKIGYGPAEFGENLTLDQKKLVAGEDITKGQVVEISGDMTVSPTTEASAKVLGVAMFDAKADENVVVETEGLFKLVAGGSITAGDKVASAEDGTVASAEDGDATIGIAINTAVAEDAVYVKFSI